MTKIQSGYLFKDNLFFLKQYLKLTLYNYWDYQLFLKEYLLK